MRGLPAEEIDDSSAALNALRAYQAHVSRWPADFRLPQSNAIYKTHLATLNRTARQGNYLEPTPSSSFTSSTTTTLSSWREKTHNRLSILPAASRFQLHGFIPDAVKPNGGGLLTLSGLDANSPSIKARTVSTRRPDPHLLQRPTTGAWDAEFLVMQRAAISSLERSINFPRVGEVNMQALAFAEELGTGWKINGEQGREVADEIVEVLYKLSTLTFYSQCIVRHFSTVLVGAERYQEVAQALKLNIQIVEKGKEADGAEAASMAKEVKDATASPSANTNGPPMAPKRGFCAAGTRVCIAMERWVNDEILRPPIKDL
ncbi:hypothetical protein OC834_006502 [Tilletia horrida]|nr:hypothetical protein OC834_006502 [Tilletia horrida]